MKKSELQNIIKEELKIVLNERSSIPKNRYQALSWLFKKYKIEKNDIESVKGTLSNLWEEAWRDGALEGFER